MEVKRDGVIVRPKEIIQETDTEKERKGNYKEK
jgi:hypothetical protein